MEKKVANTEVSKVEVKETKVKVMNNKKEIVSSLLGKDEVFKMLALAEALGLPILLVGKPGVGKTNCVTDYAKAGYDFTKDGDKVKFMEKVFILETDEGTKSSEVKGTIDMKKLVKEHEYSLISPVTTSEYVVINEVDKAAPALRNSLLGIMNEKILFNGQSKVPCEWRLFVATCNEIPKEEVGNPFWDRFVLKMEVSRMSAGDLMKYFKGGDKKYTSNVSINMPTREQLENIVIPIEKLEKFVNHTHKELSDRTLSYVPTITKNVSIIYGVTIDQALIKTADILCNKTIAQKLQKDLISPEMRAVLDKAELLSAMNNEDQITKAIEEIQKLVNDGSAKGAFKQDQVEEIAKYIGEIMENHPHFSATIEI